VGKKAGHCPAFLFSEYYVPMIAVFTDFGVSGPYLGQMKAVLYRDAPGVPVADIFPRLPPFNIKAAAYLLPPYCQYLPEDTVCLCVVDPGVGTQRRALVVRADRRWYVGPDNGLFTLLIRRAADVEVYEISWRPAQLSNSFHGRDLFAPVAARIARGEPVPGDPLPPQSLIMPAWPDELQEIVYLDEYGNAISGVRASALSPAVTVDVAGQRCGFRRTFGEARSGQVFWYENSNGLVEIAVAGGSVAEGLGLSVGQQISLRPGDD